MGRMVDDPGHDRDAGLDHPQLLETLDHSEPRFRQVVPHLQHPPPVGVDADVLPIDGWRRGQKRVRPIPGRWHRSPAEINRPPSSDDRHADGVVWLCFLPPGREHGLDGGRIMEVFDPLERCHERGDARLGAAVEQIDRRIDGRSGQLRLVPLHVDDHVCLGQPRQRFDDPGRPTGGLGRGHHRLATKGPHGGRDLLAIGDHNDMLCPCGAPSGPPGVFDERTARIGQQHLAGKTLAGEPGRDRDDGGRTIHGGKPLFAREYSCGLTWGHASTFPGAQSGGSRPLS